MNLKELYELLDKAIKEKKIYLSTFHGMKEQSIAIIIPGSIDRTKKVEINEHNDGLRKVLD
jgi:hypothetical protein